MDESYSARVNMKGIGPSLQRLIKHGVQVRVFSAKRLHQKSFLADDVLVIGPMNFSEASKQNI